MKVPHKEDETETKERLKKLKKMAGKDARNFAYATDKEWICICGTHNLLDRSMDIQNCSKCIRNRNFTLENYGKNFRPIEPTYNGDSLDALIKELKKKAGEGAKNLFIQNRL